MKENLSFSSAENGVRNLHYFITAATSGIMNVMKNDLQNMFYTEKQLRKMYDSLQ